MQIKTIILILFFFPSICRSQTSSFKKEMRDEIIDATLEVVLSGDSEFDEAFKKVVEDEWTISKYKFTTMSEFNTHEDGEKVYALGLFSGDFKLPVSNETWLDMKDEPFFGLIHRFDDKGKYKQIRNISLISSTLADYKSLNFETLLRFEIRKFNNDVTCEDFKEQKERHKALKTTTILINELDSMWTIEEIQEIYPYKVEIVSPERIEKAINNKEKVLVSTIIVRDITTLISNAEFIYADFAWADSGQLCFFTRASFVKTKKARPYQKKRMLKALTKAAEKS